MEGIVTEQNFTKGASVRMADDADKGSNRYIIAEGRIGKLDSISPGNVCYVEWDNGNREAYYMKELQYDNTIDNTYDSISDSIRNILIGLDILEKKGKTSQP